MYKLNINTAQHRWDKKNLVTRQSRRGGYDEVVCVNCGMKGRRYNFEQVEVSESYKEENVHLCPNRPTFVKPKTIRITKCEAFGSQFANLKPDSIHQVIDPPKFFHNDERGVWVMGVGEPVKVLNAEFEIVEQ